MNEQDTALPEVRGRPGRKPSGQVIARQTKHGPPAFSIRLTAYGRRHQLALGPHITTRAQAEEELANVLADVRRGTWRPAARQPVEEPTSVPTFHEFSSEWFERHRREVGERTIEHWLWLLSGHLLPFFAGYSLDRITPELVDRFKVAKLHERERYTNATKDERRQRLVPVGLNATSINKCLALLARILDEAIDYGHMERNPAKGRSRRMKPIKPRRTFLEPHEAQAVLGAAPKHHRPILATMILAGLRVGELTALRWANVDLAGGKLRVVESKTEAGVRVVDLSPMLREELALHRANARSVGDDELVFATRNGTALTRDNIRCKIVAKVVERANKALVEAGMPMIEDGITNHSLRRTFASLLYEAGASPAYVMSQMGHTSAALALEVYAKKMARSRDTGERMDAMLRAAEWGEKAQKGANGAEAVEAFTEEETKVTY
jgi:integrase